MMQSWKLRRPWTNKGYARVLKVDKAYHSHHMDSCSERYLKSMRDCGIRFSYSSSGVWISSVRASGVFDDESVSALIGPYWKENMTSPVLFSQAVTQALKEYGHYDAALEIGPHASLSSPTTQIAKGINGVSLPYHGTLHRNQDDITSISAVLGFLITTMNQPNIDVKRYVDLFADCNPNPLVFLKGLPCYPWNHQKVFWKESRASDRFRLSIQAIHELLGMRSSDDNDDEIRWKNILRTQNLMAVEASRFLANGEDINIIMLSNLQILKPITLEETSGGIETLFTLSKDEVQRASKRAIKALCFVCTY